MSELVCSRIKENEAMIYKMASKYRSFYDLEDLYQAGCMGIIKADKKYKYNSNTKFSTYAYKYILGEMIDFIRKDKNIIISDEAYEIYKKYIQIKELLFIKNEREASFDEICSFMGIEQKAMLRIIESVSITKSINEDEIIYNTLNFDNREEVDNELLIKTELEKLDDFDKSIINYRYYQGYSQEETARMMGISQVKVSRQEKLILGKIKTSLAS